LAARSGFDDCREADFDRWIEWEKSPRLIRAEEEVTSAAVAKISTPRELLALWPRQNQRVFDAGLEGKRVREFEDDGRRPIGDARTGHYALGQHLIGRDALVVDGAEAEDVIAGAVG
jgi:hypothetical protein